MQSPAAIEALPLSVPIAVVPAMSELDIMRYAGQLGIRYPTTNGSDLYHIAQIIPIRLRNDFKAGLGNILEAYQAEVARRGEEPREQPIPDILAVYMSLGFLSTAHLHEGYQHACQMGHKNEFLSALKSRNTKALDYLRQMVAGRLLRESIVIPRLPMKADGGTDGTSRI